MMDRCGGGARALRVRVVSTSAEVYGRDVIGRLAGVYGSQIFMV